MMLEFAQTAMVKSIAVIMPIASQSEGQGHRYRLGHNMGQTWALV